MLLFLIHLVRGRSYCLILILALLTSCSSRNPIYYDEHIETAPQLTAIHLSDRNGVSETISNSERLEKYAHVDFLTPQSYSKVLRVFGNIPCGEIKAIITSYYENGQLRQYLEISNNRAFGAYREWHENGLISVEARVIGGTPDITPNAQESWLFEGTCKAWDKQGNLTGNVEYIKGKLEGESLYYHSNGNIWKRMHFDNNMLNGTCEMFYGDSALLQRSIYCQNQPHGHSIRYWPDGSTAAEEEFFYGSLKTGSYYDRQGQLVGSIEDGNGWKAIFGVDRVNELHQYRNGVSEGEVCQFGSKGQLLRRWYIKNGCKHGLETEYYPSIAIDGEPLPKWQANWSEGKIHGVVKSWYPDGGQESQREMSNNIKNGVLVAWYRDGALMMMEQYEKDLLLKGDYYRDGERIPCSQVDKGEGVATIYDADGMFLRKIQYCDSKPFQ